MKAKKEEEKNFGRLNSVSEKFQLVSSFQVSEQLEFWVPFLVPFRSPFCSKSGPLLGPFLNILGPLLKCAQCACMSLLLCYPEKALVLKDFVYNLLP